MAAYIIVDIKVTDPDRYEDYKRLAAPTIAAHGGRYIVRGGATEVLEGDGRPGRIVALEFPSMEQARAWYRSPEYAAARGVRQESATAEMVLVEGA